MEFRDLKTQYKVLKEDIDKAVVEVMTNCNFISGKQVEELEKELAEYVGVKHCVSCANGTDALSLALMAWDIKEGDAVFVPDFTFFASGEVVSHIGATPVFIDVDKDTFNISAKSLENAILKVKKDDRLNPKVVVGVDLFGLPADYNEIKKVADKYGLLILEDGAQGFGGEIEGKKACSFGDISTTSFFPAKPLGCYGDGGAVFTDDDNICELLKSYRVHGKGAMKYDNVRIGVNSRLDTIQAAILSVKLKAFRGYELKDINRVADKYSEKLEGVVKTPYIPKGFYSSYAQYTITLDSKKVRDDLQKYLKDNDIPTMIYYPKPMHEQKAFDYLEYKGEDFENTISLCDTVLSLPMHPYLKDEEILRVTDKIREFFDGIK
ncbi:DegT/DnrJ/EryC1/StrS family aminotransferase [Anaerofustis stercorihominis]|uniref:DegT/DnrJ/EryC1/StrS family aminotransferase n=1 Tax=Anaerofustis stercorihominis TaxID=214853 RepID=A0A3E3E348_9FIRM|nr:DegT/DnrJ/EryC1/StrS family aminotransferase [Anaerofustis stercorihominis]RGD75338.1 DegT/DnrJ/EryC1/StrS family aminotransferase [Anaerofustis stercorihominis]